MCVFSTNHKDTECNGHRFSKIKSTSTPIPNILGPNTNREFRYIEVDHDYKQRFGPHRIKVVAIGEFIREFSGLELCLFDGELQQVYRDELAKAVGSMPDFRSEKGADVRYRLVNLADHIARMMYKYRTVQKLSHNFNLYDSERIEPDLDAWQHFFRKFRTA
ncbi:hypothetical protein JW968_06515 [Candidatus Woesearchaeota archaeon]|nr:hypothetical protein [Candidatus Woesearchaeota archaeon]